MGFQLLLPPPPNDMFTPLEELALGAAGGVSSSDIPALVLWKLKAESQGHSIELGAGTSWVLLLVLSPMTGQFHPSPELNHTVEKRLRWPLHSRLMFPEFSMLALALLPHTPVQCSCLSKTTT